MWGFMKTEVSELYMHVVHAMFVHFRNTNNNLMVISLSGSIDIPDDITLTVDSDLKGESPQFTLTCVSTGGPATTVTWSRKYSRDPTGVTSTVLDDPVTSQYTHTFTVTERLGGHYVCNVSNSKPSYQTAYFRVQGTHT